VSSEPGAGQLDDLIWSEDHTKQFENAIEELGKVLGYTSQRPERDIGKGPDNLWGIGENRYLVIECKSGAKSATISKTDSDQLSGSMNWFKSEYDNTSLATPVMIHPSRVFDKAAAPHEATVCIDRECLAALTAAIRGYSTAITSANALKDKDVVAKNLKQFSLMAAEFLPKFTKQPGKKH
jgi:hypothetical protein